MITNHYNQRYVGTFVCDNGIWLLNIPLWQTPQGWKTDTAVSSPDIWDYTTGETLHKNPRTTQKRLDLSSIQEIHWSQPMPKVLASTPHLE